MIYPYLTTSRQFDSADNRKYSFGGRNLHSSWISALYLFSSSTLSSVKSIALDVWGLATVRVLKCDKVIKSGSEHSWHRSITNNLFNED